jgi:hypothetical protein
MSSDVLASSLGFRKITKMSLLQGISYYRTKVKLSEIHSYSDERISSFTLMFDESKYRVFEAEVTQAAFDSLDRCKKVIEFLLKGFAMLPNAESNELQLSPELELGSFLRILESKPKLSHDRFILDRIAFFRHHQDRISQRAHNTVSTVIKLGTYQKLETFQIKDINVPYTSDDILESVPLHDEIYFFVNSLDSLSDFSNENVLYLLGVSQSADYDIFESLNRFEELIEQSNNPSVYQQHISYRQYHAISQLIEEKSSLFPKVIQKILNDLSNAMKADRESRVPFAPASFEDSWQLQCYIKKSKDKVDPKYIELAECLEVIRQYFKLEDLSCDRPANIKIIQAINNDQYLIFFHKWRRMLLVTFFLVACLVKYSLA